MKGFPLVLIGIGGIGTIGTTTYSIVSETNKRTKRNLVSEEETKEDLGKDVGESFQKIKKEMVNFSNENPTIDKFDEPGKPELTLKILQEFCSELLTTDSTSLSKDNLVQLIGKDKRNEIEKICSEIEDFIKKMKKIDNKNSNLKNEYGKRFNFSLTDK